MDEYVGTSDSRLKMEIERLRKKLDLANASIDLLLNKADTHGAQAAVPDEGARN